MCRIHSDKGENGNVKLFDVLEGMKHYSEVRVLKKCPFIPQGLLPDYKNHLHALLLKSLNHYHLESTVDQRIKSMIQSGTFLLSKNLLSHSKKILHKAELLALEYEKWTSLLELTALRKKILLQIKDETAADEITRLNHLKGLAMDSLRVLCIYEDQLEEANTLFAEQSSDLSGQVLRKIHWIRQHEYIRNPDLANSLRAKYYRHKILWLLSQLEKNADAIITHSGEMRSLTEASYLGKEKLISSL